MIRRRVLNPGMASALLSVLVAGRIVAATAPDSAPADYQVTFNKDIAPIVFSHCSVCHHPGQVAPFSLLKYEDFRKRAKQIGEVVQKRYMPPWLPKSGQHAFADDRSLTSQQIDLIERWVGQGAVEGDPAARPAPPTWTEGWQLGKPDLIVKMPWAYEVPADGPDIYRNFVFPIPVSERKFVRGVEFNPGNGKVVHHAFIEVDATSVSRKRAAKENPPGFDGMMLPETATMPGGEFLGWQPGKVSHFAPDGLPWVLETNTDLVLQLHLHPSGKPESVQPTVAFYFTSQAPTNMPFRLNLNPLWIDIPPGARDYAITDDYVLPVDVRLLGISPHAHYLAKQMEGMATLPNGQTQSLLLIPQWDFNWQGDYRYAEPIALPKGTRLTMRFTYDNSADNPRNPNRPPKRVRYGLQSTDEMGELWFQLLAQSPEDRRLLTQDFYRHSALRTAEYNEALVKENPKDAVALTRAGRARDFLNQLPEALQHLNDAVQADPKYDRAWYELGVLYLRLNQLDEAKQALEKVIELNPDDYEAHGNLGFICLKQRDANGAERHFEAALRANPQDSVAKAYLERLRARRSPAQ